MDPDQLDPIQKARQRQCSNTISKGIRNLIETEHTIRQEIKASVYAKCGEDGYDVIPLPHQKTFTVVDFGVYRSTEFLALPAEFTILEFSVVGGITKCFTRLLDPVKIPLGYRSEVFDAMITYGYLAPGFEIEFDWLNNCLWHIFNSINTYKSRGDDPGFIYVMPNRMDTVKNCLLWISRVVGINFRFKLMPLTGLVHVLLAEAVSLRHLNKAKKMSCVSEVAVLKLLSDSEFDVETNLACNFHQLISRSHLSQHCTQVFLKCRIYNALKLLCIFYDVPRYRFNHIPRIEKAYLIDNPAYQMDAYSSDSCSDSEGSSAWLSDSTSTLLYNASNESSSDCDWTSSSCDESDDEEVPNEDDEELHMSLATFEVYPTNKSLIAERPKRGFDIKVVPCLQERAFPSRPTPYTTTGDATADPPYCNRCLVDFCICGTPQFFMALQARKREDGFVRYGNPISKHKIWPVLEEVDETHLGVEDTDDVIDGVPPETPNANTDASRHEEVVKTSKTEKTDDTGSDIGSSVSEKIRKGEFEATARRLEVMRAWQTLLPLAGSRGRGCDRWSGNIVKYAETELPFKPVVVKKVKNSIVGKPFGFAIGRGRDRKKKNSQIATPGVGQETDNATTSDPGNPLN